MAKSKWLQEVEDDATRITEKRFRDQEEDRQYKESKKAEELDQPIQQSRYQAPVEAEDTKPAKVLDKKGK